MLLIQSIWDSLKKNPEFSSPNESGFDSRDLLLLLQIIKNVFLNANLYLSFLYWNAPAQIFKSNDCL